MIRCAVCKRQHPLGMVAVGDRVIYRGRPRADGIQHGTRGKVVAYSVRAGATHQEIHVRTRSGYVAMLAPCELAQDVRPATKPTVPYESLTREGFQRLLRSRKVVARILCPVPGEIASVRPKM